MESRGRVVSLRGGQDGRYLDAWVDSSGNLHIKGQDFGPETAVVSPDGEYEWFEIVQAGDIAQLLTVLGAPTDEDILDVLERDWRGPRSSEFERLMRNSDIDVERHVV